ncbi:GlsB/YeaQ/YmgE family stress response membrane protein [Echinicola jeungdonensis]|uniref:GlsB/YeaQ/YmgE family stress response membrane protein n=1 Tax=Echinicola jeungdonensis TaxID=709343 RepID=A0ABV5J6Z6_9BACT|nr:GlsB/YeaQ/YmgE family stress response membrane protein [Echinicola jeungdonensis]MDN3670780.1 GlsB/YeaQ/YmgE family stress response membrane protein [Echinicola jeungdonensis]
MEIIWWLIFGLIAGALAKWIMPGRDPGGIFITILIGIGGAFVGGIIGRALGFESAGGSSLGWGLVWAVIGALIILYIWKKWLGPRFSK